jgi:SWI/SNF-related matrix-associated actin-dependent regulator of chromatin subfamily A3
MPKPIPWMVPNGASQGQSSNFSKRKRSTEVVDLTDDGPQTRPAPKTPRSSTSSAGVKGTQRTPSWTQPSPSSQKSRAAYVPPWTPPQQSSQSQRDAWLQEEDTSIFDNVASSQTSPVAHEQYQKYGTLDTKIVGVRYYKGFATVGERITIKREPSNAYDPNASKS